MINLLLDKQPGINLILAQDALYFKIEQSFEEEILINWELCEYKTITIQVASDVSIKIIELGEPKFSDINYHFDENSSAKISFFTHHSGQQANYLLNLKENANVSCAFADFSYGKKDFYFLAKLIGRNARINWHLASIASNEDLKNFDISFTHAAENTFADMNNYGIVLNKATLNFLGVSTIEKYARKSETHQNAKIMIFDATCSAKASPILKIEENDVIASHGAAVGQVNEDQLFYLCSRGLQEEVAKRLMTMGYIQPILQYFDQPEIKDQISKLIEEKKV